MKMAEKYDAPVEKMLNHYSTLKSKNQKQADEIVRLKGELAKAKTSNSRIRNIPRKVAKEEPTSAPVEAASG